ncbi:MAG TPA: preQ(1) synthase [Ktedonobacterales bacterium]|nr:preQ(1) synthase [Ktedonobacterales bacterium]
MASRPAIDTIDAPVGLTQVDVTSDEGTSLCPLTGQPDQWTVTISYAPRQSLLESKSLKFYLQAYRQQEIFCENLATAICADVHTACAPHWTEVRVAKKARGGIAIVATARCQ